MKTTTESEDWANLLFTETNELKSGDTDINWIYEFLGWKKHGKTTRRA